MDKDVEILKNELIKIGMSEKDALSFIKEQESMIYSYIGYRIRGQSNGKTPVGILSS